MLGTPSVLRDWPLVFLGDDALASPVEPPACEQLPDESDADFAARVEARDAAVSKAIREFHRLYDVACETGEWAALTKPGATLTLFWVRQVPGHQWRAFDRISHSLGGRERAALAMRLAVFRVDNLPLPFALTPAPHVDANGNRTGLGDVLGDELPDHLDLISKSIVDLVGFAIMKQRGAPLGK